VTDQSDWKKKYVDLDRRCEMDAESNAEKEKLLCRTIIRLTLATKGLDPVLDPHLKKLRDALRKGIDANIQRHIAEISETLMRARDDHGVGKSEVAVAEREPDLFQRLLRHSSLTGRNAKKVRKIGARLAGDPAHVTDAQLDELIELLAIDRHDDHSVSGSGAGLLNRIFSREEKREQAKQEGSDEPMQLLISLLGKLNWPEQLSQDISSLKEKLSDHENRDVLIAVAKDLTRIVSDLLRDLKSEARDTGSFLADLMVRLQELDQFVSSGHALQEASLESGRGLGQVVDKQVEEIAGSVKHADDLQNLKQDVTAHLATIKQHMDAHLEAEEDRFKESEKNEQMLRQRLQEVEDETSSLRHKILEAQARSSLDAVTGLPNRAAYDERMKDEHARWMRFKTPLVLIVWDLDDFKQINDRFGHQAGDKSLRVIGRILKARLRKTDFVGRYGGEEFCMLLPGSTLEKSALVVEQIRKAVEESKFHSGNKPVSLTISCGYTQFRDEDSPEQAFNRADKALYQAKKQGKNCCVSG